MNGQPTVGELLQQQELLDLEAICLGRNWAIARKSDNAFLLELPSARHGLFYLWCDIDGYPGTPPAWHWTDASGNRRDDNRDLPERGSFFHSNRVICAPWNRLAYKPIDSRGPHSDWDLLGWRTNSHTGACKTLSAMALRIYVELNKPDFAGWLVKPHAA